MGYLHHRLLATSCAHPKSSWPNPEDCRTPQNAHFLTSKAQTMPSKSTTRRTPLRSFTTRKTFRCSSPPQHFEGKFLSQIRTKRCEFSGQVPWQFAWHSLPQPTNRSAEFRYKNGLASTKWRVVPRGWMKPQQVEVPNFETLIQVLNSFHWLQDVSEWQSRSHCRRPRLLVG